jgi:hypothetical protein
VITARLPPRRDHRVGCRLPPPGPDPHPGRGLHPAPDGVRRRPARAPAQLTTSHTGTSQPQDTRPRTAPYRQEVSVTTSVNYTN